MNQSIAQLVSNMDKNHDGVILIGISGAPGAGKSTLALEIVDELNQEDAMTAQFCPMDGYHYTNQELSEKNLTQYKGRIDTFDVKEMQKDIDKLRQGEKPFYWPIYSRELHDPVNEGVEISAKTRVFIVEGNYIFFDEGEWRHIRDSFDFKIFIDIPTETLKKRLIKRHLAGGKSEKEALHKVINTDLPNAILIRNSAMSADVIINSTGQVLE